MKSMSMNLVAPSHWSSELRGGDRSLSNPMMQKSTEGAHFFNNSSTTTNTSFNPSPPSDFGMSNILNDLQNKSMDVAVRRKKPVTLNDSRNAIKSQFSHANSKSSCRMRKPGLNTGRWSEAEHLRFCEGYALYENKWKLVQAVVKTRTVTQVRTHAQKHLAKLKKVKDGSSDEYGENFDQSFNEPESEHSENGSPKLSPVDSKTLKAGSHIRLSEQELLLSVCSFLKSMKNSSVIISELRSAESSSPRSSKRRRIALKSSKKEANEML